MREFDPGPPPDFAEIFSRVPDYSPYKNYFWYDWGPVFYRGRLDGSARLLCVASDPGPTERIAMRTLVGDAGQLTQGFLARSGLTRSYLCLNAFAYALFPSEGSKGGKILDDPVHKAWQNELFNRAKGPDLQAVVAFGQYAKKAIEQWEGSSHIPVFYVPHPSSRDTKKLLDSWRKTIESLRKIITPDEDADPLLPNYGAEIDEKAYARIPKRDLPFGVPEWLGDDSWGRKAKPVHRNCVRRPDPDDRHTLIWIAPKEVALAAGMKTFAFPMEGEAALPEALLRGILLPKAEVIDEDKSPTYVLKGRLVTMNPTGDVFDEARIVVSAGKIAQIITDGQDLSPEFEGAPEIETAGTIYPGLIDLHNHFVYNVLPLWPVTKCYTYRKQWASIKTYSRDISLPIRALADSAVTSRAIVRYVEVKALLGGTTTGQGIRTQVEGGVTIFKGAMRNVEETGDPRLPEAGTCVPDLGLSDDDIKSFRNSLSKRIAYFYHLAEGVGSTARKRFLDLKANELIQKSLVGIHSLGLKPEDLNLMAEKKAKVVWSPFSNLLLYGKTLDLKALKDSGPLFCIGCDWSPSGGKNLLQELKVARYVKDLQGSGYTSRDLVRAVTCNPAAILGWDGYLGSLKPGAFADLIVIKGTGGDPYDHLIDATEREIKLVVVHGTPRYGIKSIMQSIHKSEKDSLETITLGEEERSLYLYAPGSVINDLTFAESHDTLAKAMADLPAFRQSTNEENRLFKAMGMKVEDKFRILLDNELEEPEVKRSNRLMASAKTDWSRMAKSVELDEPSVDFPSYWDRLKEQANIDDDLRQMLKKAYAG